MRDAPDAPQRVTGNQRTILEALDAFDEGLAATRLQEATTLATTSFYRAIDVLRTRGYIVKEVNGPKNTVYCITDAGRAAFA